MSSIAFTFDPDVGPLLPVSILKVNADGTPVMLPSGQADGHLFNGLLDTGASATCISARVISNVELSPTGRVEMLGATGKSLVNEYFFGVGFQIAEMSQPTGQTRRNGK